MNQLTPQLEDTSDSVSEEISRLVFKYGTHSNSVLILYQGFKYFKKYQNISDLSVLVGVIAYVDTPTAWVGATDPFCEESLTKELIAEYVKGAKKAGKVALLLPTSEKIAAVARTLGYYVIQIGMEPWISLGKLPSTVKEKYLRNMHVAKQLHAKGAVVEKFDPLQITTRERMELEAICAQWLQSRKSVPLSFLNQLKPWYLVRHKKYFRIHFHGQQVGFLAAVPIPATNSWYLFDLMRTPQSPLGTTELLVIEAIDILKKEGANEVTLGTTPLAPVSVHERKHHRFAYGIFDFLYEKFDSVYGFKSLFQYKDKFETTHWEPLYFICSSRFPGIRSWYGLLRALFARRISGVLLGGLMKTLGSLNFTSILHHRLSETLVTRSLPKSTLQCVSRAKSVFVLITMNLLFFMFAVDRASNSLRPTVKEFFGYSWENFSLTGFSFQNFTTLLLSSFLHFDLVHLIFNLSLLVIFVGFLELIAGSVLVISCYFFGVMLSNPLTSIAVNGFLTVFPVANLHEFSQEIDVGCSLGVFSCLGALCHFMKKTAILITVLSILIIGYAVVIGDLLTLNHIFAIMVGVFVAMKQYPKKLSVD